MILIGAGPAGEHCAGALADGGLRVAIAERDRVAGECSDYACIRSETLLHPGEAVTALAAGRIDVDDAPARHNFMVSD